MAHLGVIPHPPFILVPYKRNSKVEDVKLFIHFQTKFILDLISSSFSNRVVIRHKITWYVIGPVSVLIAMAIIRRRRMKRYSKLTVIGWSAKSKSIINYITEYLYCTRLKLFYNLSILRVNTRLRLAVPLRPPYQKMADRIVLEHLPGAVRRFGGLRMETVQVNTWLQVVFTLLGTPCKTYSVQNILSVVI